MTPAPRCGARTSAPCRDRSCPGHGRGDEPGVEHVQVNAAILDFVRQALRERAQRRLRGCVRGLTRSRRPPGVGRDVDHDAVPPLEHPGKHRECAGDGAEEVRLEDGSVLRDAILRGLADAGVVDQEVDASLARFDVGEHARESICFAHIADDESGLRRRTLHLVGESAQRLLAPCDPGDHGPVGGEVESHAPAEPGGRAGDHRHRTPDRERRVHGVTRPPSRRWRGRGRRRRGARGRQLTRCGRPTQRRARGCGG